MSSVALTRDQVRLVDRTAIDEYGMCGLVLMENAGRGCAEAISTVSRELVFSGQNSIAILCGKGNNAGDGYVIARHLQLLGHSVTLIALVNVDELSGDALANAEIADRAHIPIVRTPPVDQLQQILFSAAIVVDCMLGTGAQGVPREPYSSAIRIANHAAAVRIAVDLPTGLDCDSGEPSPITFRADHTLTMVARKVGFESQVARAWIGQVQVISIGVPQKLLGQLDTSE